MNYRLYFGCYLFLIALLGLGGCDNVGDNDEEEFSVSGNGVFILNEGNFGG